MHSNKIKPLVCRLGLFITCFLLHACSHNFPRPPENVAKSGTPTGKVLFRETFNAHGGEQLDKLNDLNIGIDSRWKFLITRIQPLVTDHKFRVISQERLLPNKGIYSSSYIGSSGKKKVIRSRSNTRVFYNGKENFDNDVIQSTALTADSFFIFLLGPLALEEHADRFQRLEDKQLNGRQFHRIYAELSPGIGNSKRDELVLWIDAESKLTFRVHITLEGYKTTQGAHVDVTFLDYEERDGFVFPSKFHERVRGPIAIDAHSWWLTGLDINRGLAFDDVNNENWSGLAGTIAAPID